MGILALLLAAGTAMFQVRPQPPLPRYQVKRATSPIIIDGKPDEAAWAAAGKIYLLFPWGSPNNLKQATVARLLWDDNYLYTSFECEDVDITARFTRRDDPVDQDDSVQILINPLPSQTHAYIGLDINVRAVYHAYLSVDGKYFYGQFHMRGIRLATYIDGSLNRRGDKDRGWSVEVAIPWSSFEDLSRQHGEGTTWSGNFSRWDGVAPNRTFSIWSDSLLAQPSPHALDRFGELDFVK